MLLGYGRVANPSLLADSSRTRKYYLPHVSPNRSLRGSQNSGGAGEILFPSLVSIRVANNYFPRRSLIDLASFSRKSTRLYLRASLASPPSSWRFQVFFFFVNYSIRRNDSGSIVLYSVFIVVFRDLETYKVAVDQACSSWTLHREIPEKIEYYIITRTVNSNSLQFDLPEDLVHPVLTFLVLAPSGLSCLSENQF